MALRGRAAAAFFTTLLGRRLNYTSTGVTFRWYISGTPALPQTAAGLVDLVGQKRFSPQTIASYRDTFPLLLQFVHRETSVEPVALPIASLDADRVLSFLDEPTPHRDSVLLPHGCVARAGHGRPRHPYRRHSDEADRYQGAQLCDA